MEDVNILRHLLEIEGQAAVLVSDAQAEADRRVKEAEEQCRQAYDTEYQKYAAELEAQYRREQDTVKAEYGKALDQYRLGLEDMPRDKDAFSAYVFSQFLDEK